jgi:hypothetical protein
MLPSQSVDLAGLSSEFIHDWRQPLAIRGYKGNNSGMMLFNSLRSFDTRSASYRFRKPVFKQVSAVAASDIDWLSMPGFIGN